MANEVAGGCNALSCRAFRIGLACGSESRPVRIMSLVPALSMRSQVLFVAVMHAGVSVAQTVCSADCLPSIPSVQTGPLVGATNQIAYPGTGVMFVGGIANAEHQDFTVVGGRIYEWSMCDEDGGSYDADAVISILNPATNTPLCHWRITGACAEGKIRYLAPANGVVRIMATNESCPDAVPICMINWRCVNCFQGTSNGCTTAPNGAFPTGAFTPSCSGKPETITASAADGTYSTVQLTAGTPTTFSATTNLLVYPTTSWITITNADASIIYGYWPNSRTFNPPYTGTYRFYTHYDQVEQGCGTWFGDHRAVRCGTYDPCTTVPIACDAEQTLYMQGTGSWANTACGATAGIERIFTYTPTVSGVHRLDVTNGTAPSTGIRYAWKPASLGCDANNWNCLGTVTGAIDQMNFSLSAGVPILILAQAVGPDPVWQRIALRCAIPQNQTCATAVPVSTYPATLTADARWTSGSSALPCLSNGARVLWYKASGLCGTVTANTCGSDGNTYLGVYAGTCAALTEVACNDNATTGPCSGTLQSSVSWSATEGTEYFIAVANPALGLQSSVVLTITEPDSDGNGIGDACEASVGLRAALDGPYSTATGLMSDGLRTQGLLPLTEPYTALGYPHVLGGGETTSPAVLAVTGADAIVDWVLVELRSALTPSTVVASRSALLQRDGDVVGVDGLSAVRFPVLAGPYHVALRHRNHLGVMTASAMDLASSPGVIDLKLAATAVHGTLPRRERTGAFPAWALWGGDVNFDRSVKYTGTGNDRDPVLTTIGGAVPTTTVAPVYLGQDVNLDGAVRYTGGANDRDPILQSIGGAVPTATRLEQLP